MPVNTLSQLLQKTRISLPHEPRAPIESLLSQTPRSVDDHPCLTSQVALEPRALLSAWDHIYHRPLRLRQSQPKLPPIRRWLLCLTTWSDLSLPKNSFSHRQNL